MNSSEVDCAGIDRPCVVSDVPVIFQGFRDFGIFSASEATMELSAMNAKLASFCSALMGGHFGPTNRYFYGLIMIYNRLVTGVTFPFITFYNG